MAEHSSKNDLPLSRRSLRWAIEGAFLLIAQVVLQLKYKSGLPVLWTLLLILVTVEVFLLTGIWERIQKAYVSWGKTEKVPFFGRVALSVSFLLLLYIGSAYFLFTWVFPDPQLKWRAVYTETALPTGATWNGIYWQAAYIDTQLDIVNDSDIPVHNLHLTIRTEGDLRIAKVRQMGSIPACKFQPSIIVEAASGTSVDPATGATITVRPLLSEKFPDLTTEYIIQCADLGGRSVATFMVPVMWTSDEKTLDLDIVQTPTGTPEIPRRYPKTLHVSGTYETSGPDGFDRYKVDIKVPYQRDN
jgi:hypothetical protein